MKLKIITVYDEKAEAFLRPIFHQTSAMAVREFQELVNDPNHQFGKFPADYTLFELGSWSDRDAEFDLLPKKSLGNGVEFLKLEVGTDDLFNGETQQ
jgi:hypothetical protein